MPLSRIGHVIARTYNDVQNNHTFAMAAGLSYYFVMALFPALIFAAAVLAFLPIPNLFDQLIAAMGKVMPAQSMVLVKGVIGDVITPRRGGLLTFGLLGTLWTVSSGFAMMQEALNVAYDVPETRSFWQTRLEAIGLSLVVGALVVCAFAVMMVGPAFGAWLALHTDESQTFAMMWPAIRWVIAIGFTVLGVEIIYFVGPNIRQTFKATLPGALVAVVGSIGLSFALGLYFQNFANFNKTYGTLAAGIALMVWLYWTGFAILVGGEINSELIQVRGDGKLPLKHPPPHKVYPAEMPKEADDVKAA